MIMDSENEFSDAQAITASAASTNFINLSVAKDIGPGMPVPLLIQVVEAFDNLTTLKVGIQVDDNSSFSSAKVITEATMTLAELTLGAKFKLSPVPEGTNEKYMRLYYTVVGTGPSAGKIAAAVVTSIQSNRANI